MRSMSLETKQSLFARALSEYDLWSAPVKIDGNEIKRE